MSKIKIKEVYLFRSSRARDNFFKHIKNNDAKKLKGMFKRKTARKIKLKQSKPK